MKEELINKILKRVKIKKAILENLDEVVLERLCLIDNNDALEHIIKALFNTLSNVNVSIAYINFYESNLLDLKKHDYDIQNLLRSNIDSKLKVEELNKMALAKYDFQINYIKEIYWDENIKDKGLIADIILKCSKEFQVVAIYNIFSNIKTECIAEYLELAKIIAKEKDKYKVNIYTNLDWNLDILDLGLLLPVAKLISKCKNEFQAKNMYNYLGKLDSKNAPYILKNCEYFLRVTDENKLNALSKYLIYCLNRNLLVEEDKINLIINARKNYNSDVIEGALTFGHLIDTSLDDKAAEILNNSRKEYNVKYAQKLVNLGSFDSLSGAMIVNESETKYKAEQAYNVISLYANTDEIGKSLEFASLINSVHTKTEIDLINLLSQNIYLNKLGIALPMARIIANATDLEEDVIAVWECLRVRENRETAVKGFTTLIKNINPKNRKKAEEIINTVLMQTQNKSLHFEVKEEELSPSNKVKISTRIKTLVNKKLKNKKYWK